MEPHPGRRLLSPVETGGGMVHLEQHDIASPHEPQQAATDSREGTVGDLNTSTPVSRVASETSMSDETVDGVDIEMDIIDVAARPKDATSMGQMIRPISAVCPTFTDLSNYLNLSANTKDDAPDATMVDLDGYLHVSEAHDVYGWNAEWDRMHVSNGGGALTLRPRDKRKVAKVSLLQRVLSVGRATAVGRRAGFSG